MRTLSIVSSNLPGLMIKSRSDLLNGFALGDEVLEAYNEVGLLLGNVFQVRVRRMPPPIAGIGLVRSPEDRAACRACRSRPQAQAQAGTGHLRRSRSSRRSLWGAWVRVLVAPVQSVKERLVLS